MDLDKEARRDSKKKLNIYVAMKINLISKSTKEMGARVYPSHKKLFEPIKKHREHYRRGRCQSNTLIKEYVRTRLFNEYLSEGGKRELDLHPTHVQGLLTLIYGTNN